MKINTNNYFVIGGFGQKSVFISKDYTLPYYVSQKDVEVRSGVMKVPTGVTFATTMLIRRMDSRNMAPNPIFLLIGFVLVYFSVEWVLRRHAEETHDVDVYTFSDDEALLTFVNENQKRNNTMLLILIVLLIFTLLFGLLYFKINSFLFLLFSVLSFFCFALWSKNQIFKRMFVLHKIKKELIR
ncbi:hypothetical protein [Streptococcus suis]|uniref:Uncharacterized protein n=1 Tax=Streptococcus suis TaxID=1307 RepID=A0A540UPI4_STRSU|nr:hypothetical protein [Streptococcus suis]TQE86415.1 hypothetical protein FH692_10585 [Streptococcus suis]HEM3214258.1 hypothetical protein [Streptococcus suis 12814]HEM4252948.1 hypothetical protein [Streptococcus suis]HEM5251560.1 hypothetical protein [Streptococcus suis]